ncbi:hypothetical protein O7599_05605 [Streptomyces sp. WMMC500]|uniref:hypothetical protein n=1 Tax=Streptomyces sp. WMMC500 TaxID=3015154 RepID=UPI00248B86AD|nr:hypothetical protein [Streptomyces sp. WMMC500]WBB62016.1 hypothetical protein O7599_05605 [Streptomyces sp. WMMC500]
MPDLQVLHVLSSFADSLPYTDLAQVPDPKGGGNPPGWEKLVRVLRWVFRGVTLLCVVGILVVAGRMAIAHSRGEGREHLRGLGIVMGACVLAGSASGIVSALI